MMYHLVQIALGWWRLATSLGHFTISLIAMLAAVHVFALDTELLAILIAWANLCTAIHHYADHTLYGGV